MKKYMNEMTRDLMSLISIDSVEGEPKTGMPFGAGVFKALEFMLNKGEELGYKTINYDGYCGEIIVGDGKDEIAVLCHLDVVPAGDGWTYPPFEATKKDGRIYGRGAIDNKGPAVAALYALKAITDEGIKLGKKIKFILGCDEESGWKCMEHYNKVAKMPETGFSPDADFPVIIAEKGVLQLAIFMPVSEDFNAKVVELSGGDRSNMVPSRAKATLNGDFNISGGGDLKVDRTLGVTTLFASGKNAHGSTPELGKNAFIPLLTALSGAIECDSLKFILDKMLPDTNGKGMGLEREDSVSGKLTISVGKMAYEDGKLRLDVDIRYPATMKLEDIMADVRAKLPSGCEAQEVMHHHPLIADENSKLVQGLMSAYREITGRDEKPISIGGGTYARVLKNGVAFGPMFGDMDDVAHKADEYIELSHLEILFKIYKKAILNICR